MHGAPFAQDIVCTPVAHPLDKSSLYSAPVPLRWAEYPDFGWIVK